MKAAVLNRVGDGFAVEDIDIDKPRGREILVQVKASGLCHSDLHFAEKNFGTPLPAVLGHELGGVVVELGPDASGFAVGDHVVGSLIRHCGHCRTCINGRSFQCEFPDENLRKQGEPPRLSRSGKPVTQVFGMGAFAEYSLIHENQLVKIPDSVPFTRAAILGCGTITGAGSVINSAKAQPGDNVAIIGVGGVGLNAISGAKLAGANKIIAIDVQPKKKELAYRFGATDFVDAKANDMVEQVRQICPGGVDHVFEMVGIKSASEQASKMVRVGGGVYLVGIHPPEASINLNVLADLIRGQTMIRGVYMGSTNIKNDIPMYADLYLQKRFNLDDLVSREINISQINDAYEEMKGGTIARSVITSFN